jgi:hypothetical protein
MDKLPAPANNFTSKHTTLTLHGERLPTAGLVEWDQVSSADRRGYKLGSNGGVLFPPFYSKLCTDCGPNPVLCPMGNRTLQSFSAGCSVRDVIRIAPVDVLCVQRTELVFSLTGLQTGPSGVCISTGARDILFCKSGRTSSVASTVSC